MNRRSYLAALGTGVTAVAAGCVGSRVSSTPEGADALESTPPAGLEHFDLPVPRDELIPAIHSVIPAIVEPAFAPDWSEVTIEVGSETYEPRLQPADPVIGVERNGVARAYPLAVLERHEVVNDALPGPPDTGVDREPLLVTFCPSCGSSMTAIRRVRGNTALFEVSHLLWQSNLLLRDAVTGSLWSQILATAIRGPATGEQLTLVPSTLVPWDQWQSDHPDTEVLLPTPLSKPRYGVSGARSTYGRFTDTAPIIGEDADGSATGRTLVIGISADGESVAYPFEAVQAAGVVNDVVGEIPVVVAAGSGGTLVAYERRIDGETLRFRLADDDTLRAGGSRWLLQRGLAVDGPYEGTQLRRANDLPPLFRFAWVDFHPNTSIYGEDR